MDKFIIAHDVGTSSIKSALISIKGEVLAQATEGYGFSCPKPGWVEQDPEDYWSGSVNNTRRILEEIRAIVLPDVGSLRNCLGELSTNRKE